MKEVVNRVERNTLTKSFERQAVIVPVEAAHYAARDFDISQLPFSVHQDAVERLNQTMKRHFDGNAQTFVTMFFKEQDREILISKWWQKLVTSEKFSKIPERLRRLEHEQVLKLGPTSRYSYSRLQEGLAKHILQGNKTLNKSRERFQRSADALVEYQTMCGKQALKDDPGLRKYIDHFYMSVEDTAGLPSGKAGGYRYFSNTSNSIAGVSANELYMKDGKTWADNKPHTYMLYELFIRVQNKGNDGIIPEDFKDALNYKSPQKIDVVWKDEKNRVVQGDSRSAQYRQRGISSLLTKVVKAYDPNLLGWKSFEERIPYLQNYFSEFYGKYLFDSFDATEYDATTDPFNFEVGVRSMYNLCRNFGLDPDKLLEEDVAVRHYLHDPLITPTGIYKRNSTPSGHNLTGPNGTQTNLIRCWDDTAELFGVTPEELVPIVWEYSKKGIPLFSAVGDDAFQLRKKSSTPEEIAASNNSKGFTANLDKIELSEDAIHFLQLDNYYNAKDPEDSYYSVYPVSRSLEKFLFQETANENASAEEATRNAIQSLTNTRFNPLQEILIEFELEGDPKYRLGSNLGPGNFIKQVGQGLMPAEALNREWDESMVGVTWEDYAEANRATFERIERVAEKFDPARSELD